MTQVPFGLRRICKQHIERKTMPIYSSIGISGSVGRSGKNDPFDVRTVQQRLNDLMHAPRVPLAVDGKSGPKTRGMIRDFQHSVLHFRWPDGRVDPAAKTIAALNDPASESIWAQASIQPFIPDKPSGGGSQSDDVIDEIIEDLKDEFGMSEGEEKAMRKVLGEVLKGNHPGGPTSAEKAGSYGRLFFKAVRGGLVFAAANSPLWVMGAVLSMAAPFVMFYGFLKVLGKSMQTGSRIYGAVGAAYATAYWVHGGVKPVGCQTLIARNKSKPPEWRQKPEDMEKCWREGWKSAWNAMEKMCADEARKAGCSKEEMHKALQMFMGVNSPQQIARSCLLQISKDLRLKDPNVANVAGLLANELIYPH